MNKIDYKLLGFNLIIIIGFLIFFLVIKGIKETFNFRILSSIFFFMIIPLIFIYVILNKILKHKKTFLVFILIFLAVVLYNNAVGFILNKIYLVTIYDIIFFTTILLIIGFLEAIYIYIKT